MDIIFLIYLNRLTAIYGVVCKMEKVIFDNFKRTFLTPSVMVPMVRNKATEVNSRCFSTQKKKKKVNSR